MRPNPPFLLAASNTILKPGGLLKWKKQLVKDVRLLLQLTEAMKIVALSFSLLHMLCLSWPKPRLRHGRRLALLSHPNLTLNLCTFSFVLSLALLPHFPSLLTLPTQGVGFSLHRLHEIPFFCLPVKGPAQHSQRLPLQALSSHVP